MVKLVIHITNVSTMKMCNLGERDYLVRISYLCSVLWMNIDSRRPRQGPGLSERKLADIAELQLLRGRNVWRCGRQSRRPCAPCWNDQGASPFSEANWRNRRSLLSCWGRRGWRQWRRSVSRSVWVSLRSALASLLALTWAQGMRMSVRLCLSSTTLS